MTSSKVIILLFFSAVITGWLGWNYSERYINHKVSEYRNVLDQGREFVSVLVAKVPLRVGDIISVDNIAVRKIPKAFVRSDAILVEQFGLIDGKKLAYPVQPGDLILLTYTTRARKAVFSSSLPDGVRALSIPVDPLDTISGFLRPGDFVDIMFTVKHGVDKVESTVPLFQNIKILAAGGYVEGEDVKGGYRSVTIALPPEDASRILLARKQGALQFILRPQGDNSLYQGVITKDNLLDNIISSTIPKRERAVTRSIEILKGGQ